MTKDSYHALYKHINSLFNIRAKDTAPILLKETCLFKRHFDMNSICNCSVQTCYHCMINLYQLIFYKNVELASLALYSYCSIEGVKSGKGSMTLITLKAIINNHKKCENLNKCCSHKKQTLSAYDECSVQWSLHYLSVLGQSL